jgi:cytochrome b
MADDTTQQDPAALAAEPAAVRVWDWPVRLFHWAVVALVVAAVVTAKIGGNAMEWHMRAGMAVLALVLFRILWGVAGSRHARFASFVRGPAAVVAYAKSFTQRPHAVHVGHNPLGGWSVIALLAALLVQAGTGLFSNDDIATDGPLVRLVSKDRSDAITSFHHLNLWFLGALVATHLGAVAFHLVALKDNLVRPMLSGVKHLPARYAEADTGPTPHGRALVLLALAAIVVWWIVKKP